MLPGHGSGKVGLGTWRIYPKEGGCHGIYLKYPTKREDAKALP